MVVEGSPLGGCWRLSSLVLPIECHACAKLFEGVHGQLVTRPQELPCSQCHCCQLVYVCTKLCKWVRKFVVVARVKVRALAHTYLPNVIFGSLARSTQLVVVSATPWHGDAEDISPTLELLDEMVADVDSPTHGKVMEQYCMSKRQTLFPVHPRLLL